MSQADFHSVSTQPFTRLGQHGGIPRPRGHGRRNGTANNWRRRFPAPPPPVAHLQQQNIQNVDPRAYLREIHDPKPRFLPPRMVQNSRPPLGSLGNSFSNGFHPSFNPSPRFLTTTGPVNVIPYAAVPMWTSNIPPAINNIPLSAQENLSPGLSTHSSECSEDVDTPNVLDPEVHGLVKTFLGMLESDGGLEKGLNLLLNQDETRPKAAFRLASAITLILHAQRSKSNNAQSILREYFRTTALFQFIEHWKVGGYWHLEAVMPVTRPFNGIARKGMSLATLVTSLFIARVVSAGEFQDCLYLLIAHQVHFDRLCAMHTMVTQANYRLCKAKHWLRTKAFRNRLGAGNLQNPAFTWAQDGPSNFFVTDILATLERWYCTAVMNDMRSM